MLGARDELKVKEGNLSNFYVCCVCERAGYAVVWLSGLSSLNGQLVNIRISDVVNPRKRKKKKCWTMNSCETSKRHRHACPLEVDLHHSLKFSMFDIRLCFITSPEKLQFCLVNSFHRNNITHRRSWGKAELHLMKISWNMHNNKSRQQQRMNNLNWKDFIRAHLVWLDVD